MACKTPVLLVFFNRPETLEQVFREVKKARPERLYLAQDGPRAGNAGDLEKIDACRRIVEDIDWECEVFKKYETTNLGCGRGPYSALNWVFETEETAIILEDDCVPSQSFFSFCDRMLERYHDDERIFLVTGCNLELRTRDCRASYFFGYSGTSQGWATWKRNWRKMDYCCTWTEDRFVMDNLEDLLQSISGEKGKKEVRQFISTCKRLRAGENISYWDVQWQAVRYLNHQLSIIPQCNLITNIGVGAASTHMQGARHRSSLHDREGEVHFWFNQRYEMELPLRHPEYVIRNARYDHAVDRKINPNFFVKVLGKLGWKYD